jgi:FKBP-type peptidyl-prolyl cis-trans isomerase SlyD
MIRIVKLAVVIAALTAFAAAAAQTPPSASGPAIENGAKVELEYTLSDDAGKVLESNKGAKPLSFVQGAQQIIPGLERELVGMHPGEEKMAMGQSNRPAKWRCRRQPCRPNPCRSAPG